MSEENVELIRGILSAYEGPRLGCVLARDEPG